MNLATYAFVHVSPAHLLVNLFYLWVFGAGVEGTLGWWRFLLLFVLAAGVGGALQSLVTATIVPDLALTPIVGSSASCAALMGVFAVRHYRARINFLGLPWMPPVVGVTTALVVYEMAAAAIQLWAGLAHRVGGAALDGIAHWAHIGGFVFGLVAGYAGGLHRAGERSYYASDTRTALDRNNPGAAVRRWEALVAREPGNMTARLELARSWQVLGDPEQAGACYAETVRSHLDAGRRTEAAIVYAEATDRGTHGPDLTPEQCLALGNALEELERHKLAEQVFRTTSMRDPESGVAEVALIKAIGISVHHLEHSSEAAILARLFVQRYPKSEFRKIAEDVLTSSTEQEDTAGDRRPGEPEPDG